MSPPKRWVEGDIVATFRSHARGRVTDRTIGGKEAVNRQDRGVSLPEEFSDVDRVILALDVDDAEHAFTLVESLGESCRFYKIGPRLFYRYGPEIVRELQSAGKKVFLDLKIHDIPSASRAAGRAAAELGVSFLSAHVADGAAAGAREGVAESRVPSPRSAGSVQRTESVAPASSVSPSQKTSPQAASCHVVGITVLTSAATEGDPEDNSAPLRSRLVATRARLALEAGCAGVVSSVQDLRAVREAVGTSLFIVCPGIRPTKGPAAHPPDDHVVAATPERAASEGADFIVVGRPVLEASDPRAAFSAIAEEFLES